MYVPELANSAEVLFLLVMRRSRKTYRHPESLGRRRRAGEVVYYDQRIDLHGATGDEAVFRLKNLISLHRNCTLMVIHGKGSGTLRAVVRNFLRQNPLVVSLKTGESLGLPEGDGVTIVET